MEYRTLGRNGPRVSVLGFGCGAIGGLLVKGERDDQRRTVARALEAGVTYFDTAKAYGNGRSEETIGPILRELKADVVLGTKFRLDQEQIPNAAAMIRPGISRRSNTTRDRDGARRSTVRRPPGPGGARGDRPWRRCSR